MAKYHLSMLLVRVVLPASILLSIALRPFGLSLIYLLLYLLAPLIEAPDSRTIKGYRGKFLLLVFVISTILLFCHVVWHSVLAGFAPYGSLLEEHPIIRDIASNLGFVSYQYIDPLMGVHYVAPELVMFGASLFVFMATRVLLTNSAGDGPKKDVKYQQYPLITSAGKYLCLFLIMFSGILRPSVTSAIYFLVFLGAATAWSLGQPLKRGFAVVGRCVMAIMAVHIILLLMYQCSWIIDMYPPDTDLARYFGLTRLVKLDDNFFVYAVTSDLMWATLTSPLVILVTYYILAVEARELFKPKVAYSYIDSKALRGSPSETSPLIRSVSPSKRWPSQRSTRQLRQDSTGSVLVPDEESEQAEPTLLDDIVAAVIDLFQVIVRSSYIATTIAMMAWSIMFHSWLTFVLLMWANIVWLCPNQRSFMLKTSPLLVIYAMFLLIAGYIYSMNLFETELPSNITEVNLRQIGLIRYEGEPCLPLLIKSLFTFMFWVTLRQRVQEFREKKQTAVITDMAAPLHLTVSAAASVLEERHQEAGRSRLLNALGEWLRALCARYWIYVVAIMLFVIGITGDRMTIFRIIYMFLFLGFILMFQISWYWWRRLMYTFWITVIIYSMINLMLIYIYQFDNFSKIIENYLLINEKLQHDLGLEPYHPADLFLKLLTPTLFLIITIMQVHYFHKDFMALSDPKTRTNSIIPREPGSSRPSQAGASTMRDDLPALSEDDGRPSGGSEPDAKSDTDVDPHSIQPYTVHTAKRSIRKSPSQSQSRAGRSSLVEEETLCRRVGLLRLWNKIRDVAFRVTDLAFAYLDIHLVKIIFIALMLLCVINVCAMHVPIIIIITPVILLNTRKQRVVILLISTLISVYFMAKMVYQIDYIKHSFFDVNCTKPGDNDMLNITTYNNAEWVGFQKVTHRKPLVVILKGYISLICLFTFYSLVTYRQQTFRELGELSKETEKIMFPDITRVEADKDLIHCIKYLVNYGFYKFGVEISLICLMGVIGSRMDVYAVIYAGWLVALVSVRRATVARAWPAFTGCVAVLLPLQYALAVGFMPQFCIYYPWSGDDKQMKHIRTWLFLPYADSPPHATKLIFDFFLLLFASRQLRVFRMEKQYREEYPGGSNSEDIGKDWETQNFVNPVPDFLGYVGTWLDVLKRMVFLGMLWVTLAIIFLTGTNRVNLFSMGYLIGSFIFLWQGTDFYLRSKVAILQWWSWLIRYNVCVVAVKVLLQIPGCMFADEMQKHACWLVQLLGIGCIDKFVGGNISKFLRMENFKEDSPCSVPQEDIGLAWDGVCFAFLILQRRLFHSHYFFRVIDESKATTILASRGAELIEELRQQQMKYQEDEEIKILDKIKVKMERIKANQKKILGIVSKEGRHHDAEDDEEETQQGESEQVPLVRGDSDASGRGYHTPDSPASPRGFHTPVSEASAPSTPAHTPPPVNPIPPPLSLPAIPTSSQGPPSPSSALMTVSLDAYLEPRRISFESPPSSDLLPRAQSPEESYPVFSPPPIRRRHTVASPSVLQRTSIISQSSRAEPNSHHTCSESDTPTMKRRVYTKRHEARDGPLYRPPSSHQKAVRSGDYYMFDEFDDSEIHLKDDHSIFDEDEPKEPGFGRLLSTAIKQDLRRAVSLRRASAPAVRSTRQLSLGSYPHSYPREVGRRPPRREDTSQPDDENLTERDRDAAGSDVDTYAPDGGTWVDKVKLILDAVWVFILGVMVSLRWQLMRISRDYRYVSRALAVEKKILKEKESFGIGIRDGALWEPLPEALIQKRKLSEISVPEIRILAPSMERGLDRTPPPRGRPRVAAPAHRRSDTDSSQSEDSDDTSEHESAFSLRTTGSKDVSMMEEEDSMFRQDKSEFVLLAHALWYAILAHTDIACYIMVFINQIQSATILSIPLPLMVFLWGTLTIPRPTKTFWVTLIAYTEVIVLIKSMFQFEILPWNQKAIPDSMPFTAPRIIGIERKANYALYDLLLLLIIFLHRFMLKSLGLWKESSPEVEILEDREYPLSPEDVQLVVEGQKVEVGRKYIQLHDRSGPRDLNEERDEQMASALSGDSLGEPADGEPGEDPPPPARHDDDHYKVNDDQEPIITVTTTIEDHHKHYPQLLMLSVRRYMEPAQHFFQRMLAPGARVTADVYAYMFLCDFFNFLVVIFGFAAFGTHQGDGGVQAYLEENKVPIPFLVMLILQFALIIIDRALYLRKFMLGKILFQYALVIGVHIWMFFVLPFITERTFNALVPPPMWYMTKCVYLLLSAYQIRCGYPRRIIGNFLCKSYRFINMALFRCFMAVPFVFELRTLMDWIWTDTSMTLMDWLKMEDIFASVFLLKCSRYMEDEFPQARGAKKSNVSKYLLGGGVLAFVIAIIWFPLVFFAFGNTVGEPNPPTDVTVKIRIGPFLPVYQMSAQSHNIDMYTEQEYMQLSNLHTRDRTVQTFLSNYMYNDVAVVSINPTSTMTWDISPPELERLEREATSNASLVIKFTYVITHDTNSPQNPPTIEDSREVPLDAYSAAGLRNPERDKLLALLAGNATAHTWLNVKTLFPKFVKVLNKGLVKPVSQLMPKVTAKDEEGAQYYRDVQLRLERTGDAIYWRVREACDQQDDLLAIPQNNCDMLVMYTFNDKLFPETLNFISGGGIIGLYTTFVFLASRVLRGFFSGIYTKIMFDDLPNVDRVLQLCLDIYLVREALELTLEEDLFAKLVFLYRSPETMIKWTRPKEEENEPQRALPPSR